MFEYALLVLGLSLSFLLAISLGANDAATPTDCAVGAGVISIRKAVLLFAIFTSLGAILQGYMVMKTIGKGIAPEISITGAFASVLATSIWVIFVASRMGFDISVTHSAIGAVLGYGLMEYGIEGINIRILYLTIISWITSPFTSLVLAYLLYKLIIYIVGKFISGSNSEFLDKIISYMLIAALAFSAYAFGTNDIGNATGVYVTIAKKAGNMPTDYHAMIILAAFGSLGIAIGGITIGHRVIRTMAFRVTRLSPISGLAAELSNATVVYLFTTIPYLLFGFGMPISTSLASAGAIIGVGLASGGRRGVNKDIILRLASFWVLTVPVTATISATIYYLVKNMF